MQYNILDILQDKGGKNDNKQQTKKTDRNNK